MDIVSLLKELVNGLLDAEQDFLKNPQDLRSFEKATLGDRVPLRMYC